MVLATRKSVTRPMVVSTDPYMARACLECHRSIFWGMGRGLRAEIWHAGGIGH